MTNLATIPPTDYRADGGGGAVDQIADNPEAMTDGRWVDLARWCHADGQSWLEQALRSQWEKNIKLFKSQHPPGSKYVSKDYAHRSRLFRPKVRSTVMRAEAAAAAAFFTTDDVMVLRPQDDSNPQQQASAEIWTEVLNYRLKNTIPWFRLLIGAKQDSEVMGVCISRQEWQYREAQTGIKALDQPAVTLIPPENIRCSPGADWTDPVNSSPYWIEKRPMFLGEVRAMMKTPPKGGSPAWREVSDAVLAKAKNNDYDQTRQTREGRSGDPKDQQTTLREHDVIWIHYNYIKLSGVDWYYLTAGEEALLTEPVMAATINPVLDERPYVMGVALIEAHRTHPASRVELLQDLQAEANEIANQRIDNVKLAMNGRYFVRQGKVVDMASLTRSVPGAATQMSSPGGTDPDVVWHRPGDVTASSYQEQDRINVDFDELAGVFSPASVQSNRKLNETVGGMNLLAGSAGGMAEYGLRIFANTWVEPVLRQLVKLEQAYETDLVLLAMAAQKRSLVQRFGIDHITDELLAHSLTAEVNVGLAATNPDARLGKFVAAAKAVGELVGPLVLPRVKPDDVIDEIFGHAGYKNGAKRFFKPLPEGASGMQGQPRMMGGQMAPQGPPPPDPKQMAAAAEVQHRMALRDMETKAQISRDNALAAHQINRDRTSDQHRQRVELAQAFGSPQGSAGVPAVAGTSLDRLQGFLGQADGITAAVQQIAQALGPMQQAIQALAQGQQQSRRTERALMSAVQRVANEMGRHGPSPQPNQP